MGGRIDHTDTVVSLNKPFFVEFRRILFKNRLTMAAFFSYVVKQVVVGDPRIHQLLEEARELQAKKNLEVESRIRNDDESLYGMIQSKLKDNKQQQNK